MGWTEWQKVKKFEFQDIIYEKKFLEDGNGPGVARITINRPQRLNSITNVTMDEMFRAFDDASHDPMVGVVILTGSGDRAFCTGGDIAWEEVGLREQFYWRYPPNHLLRLCRKPVIAVVKGYAIGAGNHIAYCCDFTIAADNAIFGQNGPRVGSPADGYLVAYLTRVVGAKKAREMWMLCRRYNAQRALEMGLVNVVVPLDKLDEEVDRWCEEILQLNPDCIEILKATFDSEIDYMVGSYGVLSRLMYPDWFDSEGLKEAQQAFKEKRKPDFWKFRKTLKRSSEGE